MNVSRQTGMFSACDNDTALITASALSTDARNSLRPSGGLRLAACCRLPPLTDRQTSLTLTGAIHARHRDDKQSARHVQQNCLRIIRYTIFGATPSATAMFSCRGRRRTSRRSARKPEAFFGNDRLKRPTRGSAQASTRARPLPRRRAGPLRPADPPEEHVRRVSASTAPAVSRPSAIDGRTSESKPATTPRREGSQCAAGMPSGCPDRGAFAVAWRPVTDRH